MNIGVAIISPHLSRGHCGYISFSKEISWKKSVTSPKCLGINTNTLCVNICSRQSKYHAFVFQISYRLLKARNAAFSAGDEEGLRTARANLSRGIREAKRQYSRRIAHHFSDSRDTRSLWQGIQTITDYKPPPQTCDSTIPLLNELNAFFARFEAQW